MTLKIRYEKLEDDFAKIHPIFIAGFNQNIILLAFEEIMPEADICSLLQQYKIPKLNDNIKSISNILRNNNYEVFFDDMSFEMSPEEYNIVTQLKTISEMFYNSILTDESIYEFVDIDSEDNKTLLKLVNIKAKEEREKIANAERIRHDQQIAQLQLLRNQMKNRY